MSTRTVEGKAESGVRVPLGVGGGLAETEAVVLMEDVLLAVGGGVMDAEAVMEGVAPCVVEEDGVPVELEEGVPVADTEEVMVCVEDTEAVLEDVSEAVWLGVGGKSTTSAV